LPTHSWISQICIINRWIKGNQGTISKNNTHTHTHNSSH
jgi:hypothetical protein